jgi:hypothetical protein
MTVDACTGLAGGAGSHGEVAGSHGEVAGSHGEVASSRGEVAGRSRQDPPATIKNRLAARFAGERSAKPARQSAEAR